MNFCFCFHSNFVPDMIRNLILLFIRSCASSVEDQVFLSLLDEGQRTVSVHVDRRRTNDIIHGACESWNPTDVNDSDCYARRWNLLVSYYPSHLELESLDHRIVSIAAQSEGLSNRILSSMKKSRKSLFGDVGTPANPSPIDGLASTIKGKILPMEYSLLGWASDVFRSRLTPFVDSLRKASEKDIRAVENASITALNRFFPSEINVLAQTELTFSNQVLRASLAGASRALNEAASAGIVARQERIGNTVRAIGKNASSEATGFDKNIAVLQSKAQKLTSSVGSAINKILKMPDSVTGNVRSIIAATVDSVRRRSGEMISHFSENAGKIIPTVSEYGNTEIQAAGASWKELVDRENKVQNERIENVGNIIDQSSESLAQQLKNAKTNITKSFQQRESNRGPFRTEKDLSLYTASAGDWVADLTKTTAEESRITNSQLTDSKMEGLKKAQFLFQKGQSTRDAQIRSLIGALNEAQTDSGTTRSNRVLEFSRKISDLLDSLGSQNLEISHSSTGLSRAIASAHEVGYSSIDRSDSAVDGAVSNQKESLLRALRDLSEKLEMNGGHHVKYVSGNVSALGSAMREADSEIGRALSGAQMNLEDMRNMFSQQVREDYDGESVSKAEKIRNVLIGILSAITSGSSTRNEKFYYRSSQLSIEDAVASLATALSDNDEDVVRTLSQLVESFGPPDSFDISNLKTVMNQVLADIRKKKSFFEPYSLSGTVAGLHQRADQGNSDVFGIVQDLESKQDSLVSQFNEKMMTPELLGNEKARAAISLSQTQQSMLSFLQDFAKKETELVNARIDSLREKGHESEMMISSVQKGERFLGKRMGEISRGIEAEKISAIEGIRRDILSEQENQILNFSSYVGNLTRNFHNGKDVIDSKISRLTFAANRTVQSIPSAINRVLLEGSSGGGRYRVTAGRLNASLELVREQVALASNSEERNRLIEDQVLLTRIARLAMNSSTAHDALLANISNQSDAGFKALASTQRSLETVADMISKISVVTTEPLSFIAQSASDLLNGLPLLVNQTVGLSAFQAAEALRDSTFALSLQDGKHGLLADQLIRMVRVVNAATGRKIANQTSDISAVRNMKRELERGRNYGDRAVAEIVDSVLNDVFKMKALLVNGSSESVHDMALNLSMMRYAMFGFLGLWTELARSVSSQFSLNDVNLTDLVRAADTNYTETLEMSGRELSRENRKISDFHSLLSEQRTERMAENATWDSLLSETVSTINQLHKEHNSRTLRLNDLFDSSRNFSANVTSDTLNEIQKELSDYSSAIQ